MQYIDNLSCSVVGMILAECSQDRLALQEAVSMGAREAEWHDSIFHELWAVIHP